jgi:uncharacterized membrane protein
MRRVGALYALYPIWVYTVVRLEIPEYALTGLAVLMLAVESLRAGGLPNTSGSRAAIVAGVALAGLDVVLIEPIALYLPPVVAPLAIACWFAASLRAGHTPVIVRIARAVTGDYGERRTRYARRLTAIWALLCAALAAEAAVLALAATPAVWSLMTNLVNHLVLAAVFAIEIGVRWWYLGPPRAPAAMLEHILTIDWRRAMADPPVPPERHQGIP